MRLLRPSRLLGRTVGLLGRTTSRLLGIMLAFLAPLALKLGVTQRVLLTLIGVGVAVVLMLVLLAVG